jgi:hypothetical protein
MTKNIGADGEKSTAAWMSYEWWLIACGTATARRKEGYVVGRRPWISWSATCATGFGYIQRRFIFSTPLCFGEQILAQKRRISK